MRKVTRRKRRRVSKVPAILLSIFRLLLLLAVVALGFAVISGFKIGSGIKIFTPPSGIWPAIVAYWSGMNIVQRIIVVVSGIFMYSALFQVLFTRKRFISAFVMLLSVFYGYILFATAGKTIFIGKNIFVFFVIAAEVMILLSYKILKRMEWKESFSILGIQLLIIPGIVIAGLIIGTGIDTFPDATEGTGIRYAIQVLAFLMLTGVQFSVFYNGGVRAFRIEDPLNAMTGSENFIDEDGGDIDVSNM